jgi:protein-tyrosine phosphatase
MRFGGLLLLLSACFGLLAQQTGTPWGAVPLGWSSLCAAIVALAYFFDRPGWLGKRPDGTLSPWRVAALLPFYLVTWGTWHLSRHGDEPCQDRVAEGLHVGRRPLPHELPRGTTLVVDLTSEFFEVAAVRAREGYRCIPALDGLTPPASAAARAAVHEVAAHTGTIYIHCAAGHGRSGALAAAVLVIRGEADDIEQAVQQMKRARPRISLNARQRAWAAAMYAEGA